MNTHTIQFAGFRDFESAHAHLLISTIGGRTTPSLTVAQGLRPCVTSTVIGLGKGYVQLFRSGSEFKRKGLAHGFEAKALLLNVLSLVRGDTGYCINFA